jgi:ParB-like chromosome segregation protein Spo0J
MASSDFLRNLISGEVLNLSTSAPNTPEYQSIPLDELYDNPLNFFPVDDESVRQLAESIEISGLQQVPIVTPAGGGYRIVAGHRRTAAIRLLHKEHPEDIRWNTITCCISRYASPEAEELALIITNTEVRKSSWDWTSKAAKRTEELLVKLQEQGVVLPGKTRDRVAEVLKLSTAKIGRAQYIEKHLIPALKNKWNELPEQVATALAKLPEKQQQEIAASNRNKPPKKSEVEEWAKEWNAGIPVLPESESQEKPIPAPKFLEWQRITATNQPPVGEEIVLAVSDGYHWSVCNIVWENELLMPEDIQYWISMPMEDGTRS